MCLWCENRLSGNLSSQGRNQGLVQGLWDHNRSQAKVNNQVDTMANKNLIVIGAILAVGSIVVFSIGISAFGESIEELDKIVPSEYIVDSGNEIEYLYSDNDSAGFAGMYILVEGTYDDVDNNDRPDDCENFEYSVIDSAGNDVTAKTSLFSCTGLSEGDENMAEGDIDRSIQEKLKSDGMIITAIVCDTYFRSHSCSQDQTYTISSNQTMHLLDYDMLAYDSAGPIGSLIGGAIGAGAGGCCGLFGIILLITGCVTGGSRKHNPGVTFGGAYAPPHSQTLQPVSAPLPNQSPTVDSNLTIPPPVKIGADIEAEKVADTPVSVWD